MYFLLPAAKYFKKVSIYILFCIPFTVELWTSLNKFTLSSLSLVNFSFLPASVILFNRSESSLFHPLSCEFSSSFLSPKRFRKGSTNWHLFTSVVTVSVGQCLSFSIPFPFTLVPPSYDANAFKREAPINTPQALNSTGPFFFFLHFFSFRCGCECVCVASFFPPLTPSLLAHGLFPALQKREKYTVASPFPSVPS